MHAATLTMGLIICHPLNPLLFKMVNSRSSCNELNSTSVAIKEAIGTAIYNIGGSNRTVIFKKSVTEMPLTAMSSINLRDWVSQKMIITVSRILKKYFKKSKDI